MAQALSSLQSLSHPFPGLACADAHPGCSKQWGWDQNSGAEFTLGLEFSSSG